MDGFGTSGFDNIGNTVRKKRSNTSRRPRSDSQPFPDNRSLSSTPPSENASKLSSDEHSGFDTSSRRKELNLNHRAPGDSSVTWYEGETARKKIRKVTDFGELDPVYRSGSSRGNNELGKNGSEFKRSSEGILAPSNWKSTSRINESHGSRHLEGERNENKLRKVKLKVGGVTRTIHTNSMPDGNPGIEKAYMKDSRLSDARPRQKLILQDISDDDHSPPKKPSDLRAIPWKDFFGDSDLKNGELLRTKIPEDSMTGKQTDKFEPVRKSKRVPKRRVLDGSFEDGDEDEEIRYLEKLRKHRATADVIYGSSKLGRDGKKSRSERISDTDFVEDEEPTSDIDLEVRNKRQKKEGGDVLMEGKREMSLTTRQRALQSGKDPSPGSGGNLIEFPNGLPPAPPRKQKEKLSEVEQQLKKAEAAQKRRVQVEKAARESEPQYPGKSLSTLPYTKSLNDTSWPEVKPCNELPKAKKGYESKPGAKRPKGNKGLLELDLLLYLDQHCFSIVGLALENSLIPFSPDVAEAIRKILGQDSSRKKREDKNKKRQEELAQERAANATTLAPDTVRWISRATGNVLIFPKDAPLPNIFDPKPCSYPPPREKCSGPSCTNAYKYRDSKSNLPLCSLRCYKAIHEQMGSASVPTC
ncbi:hypothetical protein GIB67_014763 [Kingdonia uniflora]|uniref:INO80 complex subunit B-like conserved region domain-containing protein n=1 Tax=Kingdonia uniflora TaxID=39325 RepID=A0A7J7NUU7_9MAGN|nr:hypothetical protein GIB67_014763 [Kingdonia uniflora]